MVDKSHIGRHSKHQ